MACTSWIATASFGTEIMEQRESRDSAEMRSLGRPAAIRSNKTDTMTILRKQVRHLQAE